MEIEIGQEKVEEFMGLEKDQKAEVMVEEETVELILEKQKMVIEIIEEVLTEAEEEVQDTVLAEDIDYFLLCSTNFLVM